MWISSRKNMNKEKIKLKKPVNTSVESVYKNVEDYPHNKFVMLNLR